jgi:hypothetical protein
MRTAACRRLTHLGSKDMKSSGVFAQFYNPLLAVLGRKLKVERGGPPPWQRDHVKI